MKHLLTIIMLLFSSAIFAQTATTTLDGSASSDSDGTIIAYKWVQVSGPSNPVITNATTSKATVTYTVAGVYKYSLTVTDNSGASTTATVDITVLAANIPPHAVIVVTPGTTVQLK